MRRISFSSMLLFFIFRPTIGCAERHSTAFVVGWRHTGTGTRPLLRYFVTAAKSSSEKSAGIRKRDGYVGFVS